MAISFGGVTEGKGPAYGSGFGKGESRKRPQKQMTTVNFWIVGNTGIVVATGSGPNGALFFVPWVSVREAASADSGVHLLLPSFGCWALGAHSFGASRP